jgi:GTPase
VADGPEQMAQRRPEVRLAMKPVVAIVGRPNVGKSTLFNRIVGHQVAIVEEEAGTTRDRLYGDSDWRGRDFAVVDTGGMELGAGSDIDKRVVEQAEAAIREADVIVFTVDVRAGVTARDMEVVDTLRHSQKPIVVAANKAESDAHVAQSSVFYEMGVGDVVAVSALHGLGTGDLLDRVVSFFPQAVEAAEAEGEDSLPKVAIVGRPNAGKSSLVNALLGKERTIVTAVPGTTRDAIDTEMEFKGQPIVLIDTAGVRRRGRVQPGIEQYSVIRALRAINRADVSVLVVDATQGVTAQDTHLAGYVKEAAKGIVIAVNKWDIRHEVERTQPDFIQEIRTELSYLPYAPIQFISAKTATGLEPLLDTVMRVRAERSKRIPTGGLNDVVAEIASVHTLPSHRGRQLKILYATQAGIDPPTFVFFVNDPQAIHFSYERFLENRLREFFGFEGTPLKLVFRSRDERKDKRG